jgi:hypothetical protein
MNPTVTHIYDEIELARGEMCTLLRVRLPNGSEHFVRFYTEDGVVRYERSQLMDAHEYCWIKRPLAELYVRWRSPNCSIIEFPYELSWSPNWPSTEERMKRMASEQRIVELLRENVVAHDRAGHELREARARFAEAKKLLGDRQDEFDRLEGEKETLHRRLEHVFLGMEDTKEGG